MNELLQEYQRRFFEIPFGNSAFQNVHGNMAEQVTPERAYRAVGLRLRRRVLDMENGAYEIKLEDITIAELRQKILTANEFDKQRHELEIEHRLFLRDDMKKLANDVVEECNGLFSQMQKFPEYTRLEFEAGEKVHFQISLSRQCAGIEGASAALLSITQDATMLDKFIADPLLLDSILTKEKQKCLNTSTPLAE